MNKWRLSALAVARAKAQGMHPDGDGLYLRIDGGSKAWVLRFKRAGRSRYMGLGPLSLVSLAEARQKALEARRLLLGGQDPIAVRNAQHAAARALEATAMTFRQCAESYVAAHRDGWRSSKHTTQWSASLETHVYPIFGDVPVAAVDLALVMKALGAIWASRPETASRVRQRIEAVLNWARTRGYRSGENPAAWRGHLQNLLPPRRKVRQVRHFSALPYAELGGFMAELRAQESIAARALEFLILTAARTGEVLGARWEEIDLATRTWTLPAERTKGGREHRVALSATALAILQAMGEVRLSDYIFPGRAGSPLGNKALLDVLARMERTDLTVHGFRATFRSWAAEMTAFPREVAEMALAHTVGSSVEVAYQRGDLIEKRRRLMEAWAEYCARVQPTDNVIAIRQG